jgi:hypothetical protein
MPLIPLAKSARLRAGQYPMVTARASIARVDIRRDSGAHHRCCGGSCAPVLVAIWRQQSGLVSRVTPVHTAMRNSTRDEGGPFEVDNQVLISSHRKLLWSKAMVVSVAEKPKQDSGRHD